MGLILICVFVLWRSLAHFSAKGKLATFAFLGALLAIVALVPRGIAPYTQDLFEEIFVKPPI